MTLRGLWCCVALFLSSAPLAAQDRPKGTGEANPVPALLKNLSSDDVRIAASAARSLGIIYTPGGKLPADPVEPVIDALLPALESRKGAILRQEAATALGAIKTAKALPGLKKAIDDEDVGVACAAAVAVANVLPVDDSRAYLKQRGKEKSQNVQAATYEALAPLAKPEDAEFLSAGLTVNNWRVQMNAIKGLDRAVHAGAKLAPEKYDQIAAVLGSETVSAADAAMHFLAGVGDKEALRATIVAVEVHGDGGPQDATWRTRAYALRTLRHLGWPTLKSALPAVIRQLGDPTANVTGQARTILRLGLKQNFLSQGELFALLLTELENAKPTSLRAAIMIEMGPRVDPQYASRVAKVAGTSLAESLKDKEAWALRAQSIVLLGEAGHTGSVEIMAQCVGDDVTDVRVAAGETLQKLGKLCTPEQKTKVAPLLIAIIDKPVDWRKAAIAARTLGSYPAKEAVDPLVRLLSHNVINVQDGATHSLVAYVKTDNKELRTAVETAVATEMAGKEGAWEYGAKIVAALQNKERVPLLVTVLKRGNWRAQINAADAVTAIAALAPITNKDVKDALIVASQSEVPKVQKAANAALRALAQEK